MESTDRPAAHPPSAVRARVSPWPYLVTGVFMVGLPILGYFGASWYATTKKRTSVCLNQPVADPHKDYGPTRLAIGFSADGRRALLASTRLNRARGREYETTFTVCDRESKQELARLSGENEEVLRADMNYVWASFTPNARRILCGGRGIIILWDWGTGQVAWRSPAGGRRGICWSARGQSFASLEPEEKKITVHDLETDAETCALAWNDREINVLTFSADDTRIFAGGPEGQVWVYELARQQAGAAWPAGVGKIQTLARFPNGRHLLVGGERGAVVLDVVTGRVRRRLADETTCIFTAVVMPEGRWVILGGRDDELGDDRETALRIWDSDTGRPVAGFALNRFYQKEYSHLTAISAAGLTLMPTWRAVYVHVGRTHTNPDPQYAGWGGPEETVWKVPDRLGLRLLGTQDE